MTDPVLRAITADRLLRVIVCMTGIIIALLVLSIMLVTPEKGMPIVGGILGGVGVLVWSLWRKSKR